jgi:hypothetical protein
VKKAINVFQRDHNEAVRTSQDIVRVANTIKNHDAMVAPKWNWKTSRPSLESEAKESSLSRETHAYAFKLSKDLNHEDAHSLTAESFGGLFL